MVCTCWRFSFPCYWNGPSENMGDKPHSLTDRSSIRDHKDFIFGLWLIGYTRIYSEDIIPAQEQHKYHFLRWCWDSHHPFHHHQWRFITCRYRNEPALTVDNDPLGWWRTRMQEYPTLVRLARKYLCVPATSTQAERVFSWMGWLLNKRRLNLSGESVTMQMFLKDNLEL